MIYNSRILSEVKPDPHKQYDITEYYNTHNSENTPVASDIQVSSVPAETTSSSNTVRTSAAIYTTNSQDSLSSVTESLIIPESSVPAVTELLTNSAVSAKPDETYTTAVNTTKLVIHTTATNITKPTIQTTAEYIPEIAIPTTAVDIPESEIRTTAANTTKPVIHTTSPSITETEIVSPCITDSPTHTTAVPAMIIEKTTSSTATTTTIIATSTETAVINNSPETAFPETVTTTA
ncbi:MAG: hypothetical protein K2J26_02260 [Ruminococcus sp.]|nr:hypothetical protein [Ruminococcus sp.]